MTGSPCAADIIRAIRVASGVSDPAATSAVSSVPRASTQQPWKPACVMLSAASYPLTVPGITSTIERPPAMFVHTLRTPTSSYWAWIRCFGFGRYSGDTRPSEVESPRCATARQEVRSGPAAADPPAADPAADAPWADEPPVPAPEAPLPVAAEPVRRPGCAPPANTGWAPVREMNLLLSGSVAPEARGTWPPAA